MMVLYAIRETMSSTPTSNKTVVCRTLQDCRCVFSRFPGAPKASYPKTKPSGHHQPSFAICPWEPLVLVLRLSRCEPLSLTKLIKASGTKPVDQIRTRAAAFSLPDQNQTETEEPMAHRSEGRLLLADS